MRLDCDGLGYALMPASEVIMAGHDLFNRIGRVVPFVAARDITLGQKFVPIEVGRTTTRYGDRLYFDFVNDKGETNRLVMPKRYDAFPDREIQQIRNEIEENRPPTIMAIRKWGEGFAFQIFQYGETLPVVTNSKQDRQARQQANADA
ncbi:Phosphoenolpyruvate carboxylase [Frankliniella fusca]|uniref:Phosphoenolpyruvate carboxylase n=1 Tax=Frankliniella fusca TaxID=407009 RepID=A0AAE1LLX4_9NEOP|nr:Phosphoenolpyruvate carboxylase [Frankliniella fusca]